MLLSAVFVLVVTQSSSEIPEGLMNNSVLRYRLEDNIQIGIGNEGGRERTVK